MIVIDISKCKRSAYATEGVGPATISNKVVEDKVVGGLGSVEPIKYDRGLGVKKDASVPIFTRL